MTPVRLQRRRVKGFDLQALSRSINGLPCVCVDRSTMWGNHAAARIRSTLTPEEQVAVFERWVEHEASWAWKGRAGIDLRAHNLACWCALCPAHALTGLPLGVECQDCAPCHSTVLLELANG